MASYVPCPYCKTPAWVEEEDRDRTLACVSCGKLFRANASTEIQSEPPSPGPVGEDIWERRPRRRWADDFDDDLDIGRLPFASLRGQAHGKTAVVLLIVVMALDVIDGVLAGLQFLALGGFARPPDAAGEDLLADLDMIVIGVGCLNLVFVILTVIFFLMWLSAAYGNLRTLGARGLNYSPGWAVGYYFIPILHLFRPYQVMQEIWRGSDPAGIGDDPYAWKDYAGSPLVGFWWFFWILGMIPEYINTQIALRGMDFNRPVVWEEVKFGCLASVVSTVFTLAAGLFLIAVIRGVMARQQEKFAALGNPPEPD